MVIEVLSLLVLAAALAYRFAPAYIRKRQTKDAANWPETDATIQSAKMELVERVGHLRESVPFFDFSYTVDGEYHSGRFGLRVNETRGIALIREWIDKKANVQYDPKHPAIFCLPDEVPVDGFRISTVPETELASEH